MCGGMDGLDAAAGQRHALGGAWLVGWLIGLVGWLAAGKAGGLGWVVGGRSAWVMGEPP